MKEVLNIVVDVSGSMVEMGKIHLLRNLCRYVNQVKLLKYSDNTDLDIRFYQWSENIVSLTVQEDGDLPMFSIGESTCLNPLSQFISKSLNSSEHHIILLLSDGFFNSSDVRDFQAQRGSNSNVLIRAVAVGADAQFQNLSKLSSNGSVFLSENIASAIDSTLFGSDEQTSTPASTAQIKQEDLEDSEDDWDA